MRHWAAIAILRSVLSSPESALATLGARDASFRAKESETEDATEPDEIYRPQVIGELFAENVSDQPPSAPVDDPRAKWTDRSDER